MVVSPSRLRVSRSLSGDEDDLIQPVSDADTGRMLKDRLLDHKTSTPGPDPMIPTPQDLDEQGYSNTFGGTEEQRIIDLYAKQGKMNPGLAMDLKAGLATPGTIDAAGNINNLLWLNAQARKNELAATDFADNLINAVLPQFGSDLLTGNDFQSYQQAIQGFTAALSASGQAQGRPAANEAAQELRSAQFGVGVNDSPEEIAMAQGAREHALSSLIPLTYPSYKPEQVWGAMKMVDQGAKPEAVSAYLESEGIYGNFFDMWWPREGKYAAVRRPDGSFGKSGQGVTDAGVDQWGRPVSVRVVGQ